MDNQTNNEFAIVKEQFLQVRDAGQVNMLDMTGVMRQANDNNLYDLVVFLADIKHGADSSKKYMEFLYNI